MIYLDSRFSGYDLSAIRFPSVETCMAIVLETKDWLVGWHAMNTGSLLGDATAFGGYVKKMGKSKPIRLYGVTHLSRTGNMEKLKIELRQIADKMDYSGKISCFFMPVRRDSQQDLVTFNRCGGGEKCVVEYIDQRNVVHREEQVLPSKTRHQAINNGVVGPLVTRTIDDKTQQFVTSSTSPIRVSAQCNQAMATIGDKDWTTFNA